MPYPHSLPSPHRLEPDICDAVAGLCLIAFNYNGVRRIVQPYCHGFTRTGAETLRAVEVGGRDGAFGKLWTVAKMQDLRLTDEKFIPDDPDYNPDDSAMAEIHCRAKPASSRRG